jgi:hypothetical protein
MAADDLDSRKQKLEDEIDRWDAREIGFTWPVAIGLLMELYAVFQLRLTQSLNTPIDRLGLMLVTVGVAGELAVARRAHAGERRLRTLNAEIERDANAALKAADTRIAEFQLETEKLRARVTDRRVTSQQVQLIATELMQWGGHTLTVQVINENEAIRFADELVPAFEYAGIEVVREPPFHAGGIDAGLVLNIGKGTDVFARAVSEALATAQVVPHNVGIIRIFHEGQLALRIGPK